MLPGIYRLLQRAYIIYLLLCEYIQRAHIIYLLLVWSMAEMLWQRIHEIFIYCVNVQRAHILLLYEYIQRAYIIYLLLYEYIFYFRYSAVFVNIFILGLPVRSIVHHLLTTFISCSNYILQSILLYVMLQKYLQTQVCILAT